MTTRRNRKTIAAHSQGIELLIGAKARQGNYEGKALTYSDIAKEAFTSDKTVRKFFEGKKIT